jgi:hypothetical protein
MEKLLREFCEQHADDFPAYTRNQVMAMPERIAELQRVIARRNRQVKHLRKLLRGSR